MLLLTFLQHFFLPVHGGGWGSSSSLGSEFLGLSKTANFPKSGIDALSS